MVADACFKGDRIALRNLINGVRYPSPAEIDALERMLRTPITLMLEPALLIYRNGPWPALRGTAQIRHEFELRAKGVPVDPDPHFYDNQLSGYRFYGPNGEIRVD